MHNRVRMVAASFLTKDLLVPGGGAPPGSGIRSATPTSPTTRWVGSGSRAAAPTTARRPPRILNPVAHGRRFDPDGAYVRRWVPELARLPGAFLHRPFAAPRARSPTPASASARPTCCRSSTTPRPRSRP